MSMLAVSLAVAIGVAIGLLGGGGSLLTVPVFTYVLGFEARQAVAMSLLVVGSAAAAGAARAWAGGMFRPAPAALTGASAMAGAGAGAWASRYVDGHTQLLLLAWTMIVAAATMTGRRARPADARATPHAGALSAAGAGVGVLTGLVGVSGGFLIVPALVVAGGLTLREAVGTSLFVMAGGAAAGFAGYAGRVAIAWPTVLVFSSFAALGTLAGGLLGDRLPPRPLQKAFAVVLVVLACYMLARG